MTRERPELIAARNRYWRQLRARGMSIADIAARAGTDPCRVEAALATQSANSKAKSGPTIGHNDDLQFRAMAQQGSAALARALGCEPGPTATGATIWCAQCDRLVAVAKAAACSSRWCKAKAA